MKISLILILVIKIVVGSPFGYSSYIDAIERCNKYVDEFLVNTVVNSSLESYPVYGKELNFQKKIIFYPFKCSANLTEGHIIGFGNLQRKSPCSISFENKRLRLHTQIETKKIKFNFKGEVSAIGSTADVLVKAVSTPLKIEIIFSFNGTSGENGSMDHYRPSVISNMTVWIEGLGLMEWIKEPMEKNVEGLFYDLINTLTYNNLRDGVAKYIQTSPFPIEDLEDIHVSTTGPESTVFVTTPRRKDEFTKEDADSYVDSVLSNRFQFEAKYSKLDPLTLNDARLINVFVQKQKLEDGYDNYLNLKKGVLEDLSNVKRESECTVPELIERNITFTCNLGFDEISLKYEAEARNGTQVYNFILFAFVKQTKLSLNVTSTLNDNVPTILNYQIDDIGKISIKAAIDIVGAEERSPSAIETLYNSQVILKYFSKEISSILNGRFKEVLNYSIYKTPLHFLE